MRAASALLTSLLCARGFVASAQNATTVAPAGAGGVLVDVQGQSGKFTVYKESEGKAKGIQITMDALRELDSAGNAVGASGSTKHSINTFAAQAFTIAAPEDVTLSAGQLEDGNASDTSGVSASKISFSSPVSSIGTVRIDTYIMKEAGNLGPPNETWAVSAGDMKWNIELSNWNWCGCSKGQTQEVGDMIDVDVTVKGLFSAAQGASSKSVNLGGGVTMELSDQVNVDGTWAAMPAGYPKVNIQGSSTTLTFRFPKFTTKVTYDPAITGLSSAAAATTTVAPASTTMEVSGAAAAMPAWLLLCLAALLAGRS
mmetsp:Transcript_4509/g.13160  ORF Transcript_4509/g.13160 Transcript_4509/m.13160 type:complete len:313 (-) Transcript_4509:209-1147(-)